jgi:hypothetical protein
LRAAPAARFGNWHEFCIQTVEFEESQGLAMNEAFRLSRIRAPRATLTAAVLLAAVFVVLGLLLTALAPDQTAHLTRPVFDGPPESFVTWMLSRTGGH